MFVYCGLATASFFNILKIYMGVERLTSLIIMESHQSDGGMQKDRGYLLNSMYFL